MANTKIWQQEIDDYTKVMGAYGQEYDGYVDGVGAYNNLPYITRRPILPYIEGELSDGRKILASTGNSVIGTRVNVDGGIKTVTYDTTDGDGKPAPTTRSGYVVSPASVPTAPAEPNKRMPTFTRAQASKLNNPDPSAADGARNSTSYVSRLKEAKNISGSAYTGSMDSGVGILQKVLTKKL